MNIQTTRRACVWAALVLMPITSASPPMARADDGKKNPVPLYEAEKFCARAGARSLQSPADCLATELAFKWTLSRVWPHLNGPEKDQAEICVNTVAFTLPETGSFRVLAECVSGLSNVNE
jgi:hypothetical protein